MANVALTNYFNYLVRNQHIREYQKPIIQRYRVDNQFSQVNGYTTSLELLIPAIWQAILMPGEARTVTRRPDRVDALPGAVAFRLTIMGFVATQRTFGNRAVGARERRYVLRPHDFPLTVAAYRAYVVPNLYTRVNGARIPTPNVFERSIWEGQFDYYRDAERFQTPQALDAFRQSLPPHIWAACGFR